VLAPLTLCAALATAPAHAASSAGAAPAGLQPLFDDLAALTREGEWGPAEWARGSLLAVRLFQYGQTGVPYLGSRFQSARDPQEGFLAGAYVAVHGADADHKRARTALETSPQKREWLRALVGDGRAMTAAVKDGGQWRQAADLIPTLGRARSFCSLCTKSEDVLVRRAGLYWGFWIPDAAYWSAVQKCMQSDPDKLTRQFALYLIKNRGAG
jgi:hypothetical protein